MVVIKESNEALVDVCDVCSGLQTVEGKPIYLRKTVAEMVKKAKELLPEGYSFFIVGGWRSKEDQKAYFFSYKDMFLRENPDWTEERVVKEVGEYVYPYEGDRVSGHMTGAAVDLKLMTMDGFEVPLESKDLSFQENAKSSQERLPEEVKNNRKIFFDALTKAGFINNPDEYWHWSYGDTWWAELNGEEVAIYGVIER